MDNYTRVNLMELRGLTAGPAEGIEARFGRGPMGVKMSASATGATTPSSQHDGASPPGTGEAYLVNSGSGEMMLDGDVIELGQRDLASRLVRAFAAGPGRMKAIALGGPKPEGGAGEPGDEAWPDS